MDRANVLKQALVARTDAYICLTITPGVCQGLGGPVL